ncbi:MAG: hypothetical protein DWB56_10225 [Candidatus Jettenia sp.]|uniref:Uncharacterized protein n=1 Tax=Candidatus Jettenia caeni TaxID=247490 RepID=I3IL12_9BACT|nr:hypothetical protein [Candidatus Jettenia sp. AMX1]MBC6929320.1 hypothetical protein [Candidatus Jettenia sp.]NUN22726.1 hypothetical protein [Candidatus Jettenia caeni]KAA0249667.1 MAG: hypothetical protein EDM77_07935 [Candidatus Jettenia sp. AMX1]MDL1939562.1 hypothetical protein [Candidatus Jettenia sp. AMX1]GAB62407.1 hypothetical protein KSU1_C0811 [Candidatus Jettenia caeni]
MKIKNYAYKRIQQRGLDTTVIKIIEETVPIKYIKKSQQGILDRRTTQAYTQILRKIANKIEKFTGTKIILDGSGSMLLTAYRLKRDKKKHYKH